MAVSKETHDGNLNRTKVVAQPSAGCNQPAGKSSMPDAVLRTGMQPKAEAVRQIDPNTNADVVAKCVEKQGGTENNPKKRTTNFWGTSVKSKSGTH